MLLLNKIALSAIWLSLIACSTLQAQNAYLATLNKNDGSVIQRRYLPGVAWPTFDNLINSTFDQNHQHYIFLGLNLNPSQNGNFFDLYTIDALTGAILDSPPCSNGNITGFFLDGLEYDNHTDSLYAIYSDPDGKFFFCSIDPSSGVIHLKTAMPGGWGFVESTFDTKDNLYIVSNTLEIRVISASSGAILYDYPLVIAHPHFDNVTGKLYVLGADPTGQFPQGFDSVTVSTGAVHLIAGTTSISFPDNFTNAMDEYDGEYAFVAAIPFSPVCADDSMHILDINTGALLSVQNAPGTTLVPPMLKEYTINYCFDNSNGNLYGLDWHPPDTVTIRASANPVCSGQTDSFTAVVKGVSFSLAYQWKIDGKNVGTNDSVFTTASLANGDTVTCSITLVGTCTITDALVSNRVIMQVLSPARPSSIGIAASSGTVCSGDTILFVATPVNGGAPPAYQWQINGINTGPDKDSFLCATLRNGDSVDCILTPGITCGLPVISNKLGPLVNPVPLLFVGNDTLITPGNSVHLDPSVTGTGIDGYQWTPATGLNDPSIEDPIARPVTSTTYQLTVEADDGCKASGEITILVYYRLQMPGGFTPNGDGKNDIFRIPPSIPLNLRSFSVFNRWGQLVFVTTNADAGWDGTINGQPQPSGLYVWKIEYLDLLTGKPALADGTVMLIR